MEIYGGPYEAARMAPRSEWIRFPYRRSQTRESFFQALFRLLGIPEVQTDISGNVTMNQVLRLLYADQLSPIENCFRFEQFDQQGLRDTVGRLLCGAYNSSLYDNEQKIRSLNKEIDTVNGELSSLFQVLGKTETDFTPEWVGEQRRSLVESLKSLQKEIEYAERGVYTSSVGDELTLRSQEEAYTRFSAFKSNWHLYDASVTA